MIIKETIHQCRHTNTQTQSEDRFAFYKSMNVVKQTSEKEKRKRAKKKSRSKETNVTFGIKSIILHSLELVKLFAINISTYIPHRKAKEDDGKKRIRYVSVFFLTVGIRASLNGTLSDKCY
jgi:hypothetical protein